MRVAAQLVALGDDAVQQLRPGRRARAEREERRNRAALRQQVQHPPGETVPGPVVVGERERPARRAMLAQRRDRVRAGKCRAAVERARRARRGGDQPAGDGKPS